MAGVLQGDGNRLGVEPTGVFRAVLKEDMIDTVKRVKKPFIDAYAEALFFEDADYPLTYVPMFNMVLPLKKGQEVWVEFNQDSHRYPVLWKLAKDLEGPYTEGVHKLPPSGQYSNFPGAEDTAEVLKVSDNMWFICTESYGVLHWGDQCILLNDSKILIGNGTAMMGNIVNELLDIIINLKTAGNPTQHFVSPDQIAKLIPLKQAWEKAFVLK